VAAGWEWTLWICALLCCVLALVLQPGRERWDDDRDPGVPLAANPLTPVRTIWRLPALRRLAFAGATLIMSQVTIHSYTVAMFYEQLSMPLVQAGLALTTAQAGAFVGRPFWGWLADRSRDCLGVLMVLAAFMAACALASATVGGGWSYPWSLVLFFFFGTTASGWHGAYLAELARISPSEQVGTVTSGVLILIQLSSILTPILFATLFLATRSYSLSFGMLVIPAIASVFLLRAARSAAH
jgi:nitrate/nitrite transporter NarK